MACARPPTSAGTGTGNGLDHAEAPVLDALAAYRARQRRPFAPPGHKQGGGADARVAMTLGRHVLASDVQALGGLDDRRMSGRVLERAERLMADAVGADRAYFSTCGSSLAVKAAMLAVACPGERLLVARNTHTSVVAGLVLAGIEPVWVEPRRDAAQHLAHSPGPEEITAAFARAPDARGMLLVSPTAYGTCADLRAVAGVCHDVGRPLIVDEAWGAHLPFHEGLPDAAMAAGADLSVTSVHKAGAGLEQGSVFHLRGDLVDPDELRMRADLLSTTSPSVLIWAGLDGWRRQMAEGGRELLDRTLDMALDLRDRIGALPGLLPLGPAELVGHGRAFTYDPLMIVIDVAGLGTSGYALADRLRERFQILVGLADHRRIIVQLSQADTEQSCVELLNALADLVEQKPVLPPPPGIALPSPTGLTLDTVMSPRDAFFGPVERVPLEEAAGRIAAETASPCPPGVPVLCPGERIGREAAEYLRTGVAGGMYVPDATDPTLRTLRVVAERASTAPIAKRT